MGFQCIDDFVDGYKSQRAWTEHVNESGDLSFAAVLPFQITREQCGSIAYLLGKELYDSCHPRKYLEMQDAARAYVDKTTTVLRDRLAILAEERHVLPLSKPDEKEIFDSYIGRWGVIAEVLALPGSNAHSRSLIDIHVPCLVAVQRASPFNRLYAARHWAKTLPAS